MSQMPGQTGPQLRHVAIIMDGNNRWAYQRKLKSLAGHHAGAQRLQEVVEACKQHDIEVLTVFAFSSENWRRPSSEVKGLMSLFSASLRRYRSELKKQNVSLRVIGRRDRFSTGLQKQIREVEEYTAGSDRILVVAADYGGRWDITQAMRAVAQKAVNGELSIDEIDERVAHEFLSLPELPEVDLLIRTGAETRISNFLLWQISYAELYFSECLWPDFDASSLAQAVQEFYSRQRRFGDNPLNGNRGIEKSASRPQKIPSERKTSC